MTPMSQSAAQTSLYVGLIISLALYGIYLGIFFLSFHYIRTNANSTLKQRIFYIVFSIVILALNTSFLAIELENSPLTNSGPTFDAPSDVRPFGPANILQFVSNLLSDALLIYRCYIVFQRSLWVIILPCLLAGAFLGVSIYTEQCRSTDYIQACTMVFTLTLNVLITAMICIRMMQMHLQIQHSLRTPHHRSASIHVHIIRILIEAAAPWTILGLITITTCWNSAWQPISHGLFVIWAIVGAISPQLVILRVAMGRAWDGKQSSHTVSHSQSSSGSTAPPRTPDLERGLSSFSDTFSGHKKNVSSPSEIDSTYELKSLGPTSPTSVHYDLSQDAKIAAT